MIHPHTELRYVNEFIGYGVFATQATLRGAIVYGKDKLEIELTPHQFSRLGARCKEVVEKYAYIDHRGACMVS